MRILLALTAFIFSAMAAHAATLNIVGGELVGASNVDVGGALYDVEFMDGTCVGVFSGCDETDDFTFTTLVDATAAAQALANQVFVGDYDTAPTMTAGCSLGTFNQCIMYVMYSGDGIDFVSAANINRVDEASDLILPQSAFSALFDTGNVANGSALNIAVFSVPIAPIPLPAGAPLLLGGFSLLAFVRRKRRA